jgi:predicted GTPase
VNPSDRQVLVVGKPNAGKTLLVLNLAAYLGRSTIAIALRDADGQTRDMRWPLARARHELVSSWPHKTLTSQLVRVEVPSHKTPRTFCLVDTAAVEDGIADRADVRRAMADTLGWMTEADVVLHVVDTAALGRAVPSAFGPVDRELLEFAPLVTGYAVVASKMDQPEAGGGLRSLARTLGSGPTLIPVSAVTRQGFREVKRFLLRHL